MEHRTGVLGTRALVEGEAACAAVLRGHPDFDPEGFAAYVVASNLREWFAPLLDDPSGRALLTDELARDLAERRAAQPALKRRLLDLSGDLRTRYAESGIPVLFLKGLYLADRFYGDLHRRHQYDVDVLVPREHFARAVEALGPLGFDVQEEKVRRRLSKLRDADPEKVPQTATLRRADRLEIDLHCRLKSRQFPGIDERLLWADRAPFVLDGTRFETLSDEHTLMFLLVSLADDLRNGKCRAKHFLDLYLVLRAFGPAFDWEAFLARREREGLVRTCINVLAIFLVLWDCGAELPGVVRAVARRRGQIEIGGVDDAQALMQRAKRSRRHRRWFRRLAPGSRVAHRVFSLGVDLPHTLRRLAGPGCPVPGGGAPGDPPPGLPIAIAALLAREGLEIDRAEPVTALPGSATSRSAYRITLADGRRVKGRIVTGPDRAGRMARWIPALPKDRFPALLAAEGSATLEAWLPGRAVSAPDAGFLEEAGALLADVHRVIEPERVGDDDARVRAFWAETEGCIEALRADGLLAPPLAARTRALLGDRRPPRPTWGLRHGDFCLDNLLVGPAGVCCIDNATVGPGWLEADLAQTFYRWPLRADQRAAFLRGYGGTGRDDRGRHDGSGPQGVAARFLAHERTWEVVVALRSAAFRHRSGIASVDAPLGLLAARV